MIRINKDVFIFVQELCIVNALYHLCWNDLFWTFAAGILWKLNPGLFLRQLEQRNGAHIATTMTPCKKITVPSH